MDLPGAWRLSPPEADAGRRWNVEREDGSQEISVYPLPIPRPAPASEWREDLASIINLRRDKDREAFGAGARFSEPEYRAHESSWSAFYTVYDPGQGFLLATMVKMVRSRWCVASLSEDGTDEAGFSARAKLLLGAIRVEP